MFNNEIKEKDTSIMKSKKRIQWLDFAKGLLIFSVVLVHFFGYIPYRPIGILSWIIFIVVMPGFFAISGYLYNPSHDVKGFVLLLYKKVSSFIIPYIVFTFLYVFLFISSPISYTILKYVYRIYLMPIGYLWFLYVLFFIFIIVGLMNLIHINLYIQISISVVILILCNYLPWQESAKNNINPIAGIGEYILCFYIGYLLKKFKSNINKYLSYHSLFSVGIVLIWMMLILIQKYISRGQHLNVDLFNYDDTITKLLSIPVCFIIFSKFPHNWLFKYFDKYGKDTLIIYLVHFPILLLISKILIKVSIYNPILLFFIYLVPGWYLSILVCYLEKHFTFINFIFYPRKYISKLVVKTKWGRWLLNK